MGLFQRSVLSKFLKQQDKDAVAKAYKKFSKHFHNAHIQENIRNSKEEQYQEGFLRELFVDVFGYTLNPQPKYNLTTELKNEKGAKKADGAILKEGNALGVIELKGTDTKDLEKVRQQAFDYKANQSGCVYVITSNFEKLRFYINNAVEWEEFDLFTINEQRFELLYLCLSAENLLNNVPLRIKEASIVEEESITKKFYADYSLFKRELYRDLVKRNMRNEVFRNVLAAEESVSRADKNIKLSLFKKSQKLIDRFLFIFFAEDRGLLPPNSTLQILDEYDKLKVMDAHVPLYDRFKLYFNYLDQGRKGTAEKAEIFAYNGGLFKPDTTLDSLLIDDDLLYKHARSLAKYDFESQVDVNILGHIFENSLNEIESVNAEIEGVDFDKQKTKRKKDGVFYTPKYITKYIVDNTVGKLCQEKKAELGIIDEEYTSNRQKDTKRKLLDKLEQYRSWLLEITICDPACGSGAFLNQALDFLINEHRSIDELQASLLGGGLVFPDIENTILEKNIYGVDLNEESVEIAKLSLWLRTAQPRRKLNDLNNNIKCGNSLIDSKAVAGDKAFSWEKEFPEVFAKAGTEPGRSGGFDVVIGNPPYVRVQGIKENYSYLTPYYEKNYKVATGRYDIYTLFIEKAFKIINKNGLVSFILPHNFLISDFGEGARKYLSAKKAVNEIVHFGSEIVFKDASTYTCILSLSHLNKYINYKKISPLEITNKPKLFQIDYSNLSNEKWNLEAIVNHHVFNKINSNKSTVKDIFSNVSRGIVTGADSIFLLEGEICGEVFKGFSSELQTKVELEANIMRPILKGSSFSRYENLTTNMYILYPHILNNKTEPLSKSELQENYPKSFQYLLNFKETLIAKKIKYKTNPEFWWSLHNSRDLNLLEGKKIVTPYLSKRSQMTIDENGKFFSNDKCSLLRIKETVSHPYEPYLGIFNSSLFWFFIQNTSSEFSGGYFAYTNTFIEPFPLPEYTDEFEHLTIPVKNQLYLTSQLNQSISKFIKYVQTHFFLEKLSKKLQSWHELSFSDFIKELNKAIKTAGGTTLTKLQEMEWMEVFETKKKEVLELKAEIDKTDKEIDNMVYQLYGLTEEEIKIVEAS